MNRALGMLGLSARAGMLQSGEQAVEIALKKGQARLVLLDGAASPTTCKAFSDVCAHHSVPIRRTGPEELGQAIGKPGRRVAVITDDKLAGRLATLLAETPAEPSTTID